MTLDATRSSASGDVAADFVVIGSGAAGLTAALVAAAGGAKVVLLEKTPLIGGTTAMSGGVQWIPLNDHMKEVGVEDSRDEVLEYLRACEGAYADEDILVSFVDNAASMLRHLEALGVPASRPWPPIGGTHDYRPWLPGAKHGGRGLDPDKFDLSDLGAWAKSIRIGTRWRIDMLDYYAKQFYLAPPSAETSHSPEGRLPGAGDSESEVRFVGSGTALVGGLFKACLGHDVEPLVETPAVGLVMEGERVVGVRVVREGMPAVVRARHGVLVATGGYGGNPELKRLWLNRPLLATCEIEENQGDGHLMGMAVGAQLAGLGDAWWMPYIHVGIESPGVDGDVKNIAGTREDRVLPHTMIVNKSGKRFVNETTNYYDFGESFGARAGASPRNFPAWLIFDRQGVERYAMLALKVPADGTAEWLTVGDSLSELAKKLGIDASALAATAERFNRFARAGTDLDFHRGESRWDRDWGDPNNSPNPSLGTIEKPPFYAVELVPGALATKGGLRVNASGQVLSALPPFGPIPGLYAAGNCSNAAPSASYPGPGSTLGPAMTFGYLIGRQIAELVDSERSHFEP